jgi:hypothetical protein
MQLTLRERLTQFAHLSQNSLFDWLSDRTGVLTNEARALTSVLGMIAVHRHIPGGRGWKGRPSKDRAALVVAFLAKSIYRIETTRKLIERLKSDRQLLLLCGWKTFHQVPHESTFSRAFADFAASQLPQRLHEAVIRDTHRDRLIGHISRHSTAIAARERFDENPMKKLPRRKRGRPGKGERPLPPKRLARQRRQTRAAMLSELPAGCNRGAKMATNGHLHYGRGYKLHLDIADGQIPVSCLLTSASLQASQAAIPLATMTAQRVVSLYDLMDSAYDAGEIHAHSHSPGHVPLIAPHPGTVPIRHRTERNSLRGGDRRKTLPGRRARKRLPFDPAQERRFELRTMSERVNARLKDEFGASRIRVRGPQKVMAHRMFGVLALTVDQLLRLAG